MSDEAGKILVDRFDPGEDDFLVEVDLLTGNAMVDLLPHGRMAARAKKNLYRAEQEVCRVYVKFGHVLEDRKTLKIRLSRAGELAFLRPADETEPQP